MPCRFALPCLCKSEGERRHLRGEAGGDTHTQTLTHIIHILLHTRLVCVCRHQESSIKSCSERRKSSERLSAAKTVIPGEEREVGKLHSSLRTHTRSSLLTDTQARQRSHHKATATHTHTHKQTSKQAMRAQACSHTRRKVPEPSVDCCCCCCLCAKRSACAGEREGETHCGYHTTSAAAACAVQPRRRLLPLMLQPTTRFPGFPSALRV